MSSRRSIVWLVFFILLAGVAHLLISARYGGSVVSARTNPLVPGADRATLLELSRPGAPSVVALRSERWRMIAPFAAAVDSETVLRALDALAFSSVTDVLTDPEMRRLGRSLADFGLEDPSLRLTVRCDLQDATVSFGRHTPGGDGVYARISDRSGVCVVASNVFASVDLSLDDLRNPKLLTDGPISVSAVDVRRSPGRFVRVSRQTSGAWQMLEPAKAPVAAARVTALVQMLSSARSLRFVWPVVGEPTSAAPPVSLLAGYGLDPESAMTVSLTAQDGSSRYVSFGKAADGDSVYALVQNGGAVVTVPVALRDRLLVEADSFAELKLFSCEESEITTLSIADGDVVYLLARTPDGEWRIDSPVSAPADQDAVRSLIRTVLSLRTTERDPQGLLVSVSSNATAVVVSRDAVLVQNRLENLRSKTVLRIPSDRIRRVSVTDMNGRLESAVWDASNRTWLIGKPDGAALDGLALAGVLNALDPLTARAIVRLRVAASEAGNYGLENPRFTLAIDPSAEGAVRRNVMIGSPAPGGGAYATVGSTDAVVILPDATVRALTTSFSSVERE